MSTNKEKINLQELALCELKLTNLQVVALNEISAKIEDGEDDYASYEGVLSEAEDKYLRAWLEDEGIELPRREDVAQ